MTVLDEATRWRFYRKYSRAERKAMDKACKLRRRGRIKDAQAALDELRLELIEVDLYEHGIVPEFSPTQIALIPGILKHRSTKATRAAIKHDLTEGMIRIADNLGLVDRAISEVDWQADPLVQAALGIPPEPAPQADGPTDAQLDAMWEAATCRDTGGSPADVQRILDAAGASRDDFERAFGGDLVEPANPAPAPVDDGPAPTTDAPTVRLPGHLDLADPSVRSRVEAKVVESYGASLTPVVMWPRELGTGQEVDVPVVMARPSAVKVDLVDVKTGAAELLETRLQEEDRGDLVLFDPHRRVAVAAHLDSRQRKIRNAIAARLGAPNHAVELALVMHEHRVDQVVILRAPLDKKTGPERQMFWNAVIGDLPGGSSGWLVDEDEETGVVRLVWGPAPRLPEKVLPERMLPQKVSPDRWNLLPLGVMADGQITGVDLGNTPHTLIVGPTGSGKTVLINMMLMAALSNGHRLHILDPIKGVDFVRFEPYATSYGDRLDLALEQIQTIYKDIARRKEVLKRLKYVKWDDVPEEVRTREGLVPELIVIDEYTSLVAEARVPAGLPKEHPLREEISTENAARGIISTYVGKIAREARFVGSHLVIGTQRPDAKYVDGEMREQLGTKIQLLAPGKPVSREALGMVFSTDQIPMVHGLMLELDDGRKGLALVAAEGGSVAGFRAAFSPDLVAPDAAQALLDGIGVPRISHPWDLEAMVEAARVPEEGEIITPRVAAPVIAPVVPAAPVVAPKTEPDVVSLDDLDAVDEFAAITVDDELPPINWGDQEPTPVTDVSFEEVEAPPAPTPRIPPTVAVPAPAPADDEFGAPAPVAAPTDDDEFGPAPVVPAPSWDPSNPFG